MQKEIEKVISVLKAGGVILYPTDTVWGLGCDVTNEKAVHKLFNIKQRMEDKSIISLVDNFDSLQKYTEAVDNSLRPLFENEKPTTVILPKGKKMAKGVINQNGSVAFRIPKHPFCQTLLKRFDKPLASTSANISGKKAPAYFDEISEEIKQAVDYIVLEKYEECATHRPSRILLVKETKEILVVRD